MFKRRLTKRYRGTGRPRKTDYAFYTVSDISVWDDILFFSAIIIIGFVFGYFVNRVTDPIVNHAIDMVGNFIYPLYAAN